MHLKNLLAEAPGIDIFGVKVYAYALIIVSGMIAAFFVISLLFKRRNMSADLFLTFFCICLPVAILTTRLFYCITSGMHISEWFDFESIREGGLSIIGGILGGLISVIVVCLVKKVNFFRAGDCIVVGLLLAQAIGRWGNFANQEVYGMEVTNPALQCFPFAVYINKTADGNCMQTFALTFSKWFGLETDISGGTWHYAFFFYESLVTFTAAVLLFLNAWKNPYKPNGVNTCCYFITYGLVRSIMEPLRDPSFILGDGIPWSLVTALALLIGGLAALATILFTNKKNEGKLFGSLKGEKYGIAEYIGDDKKEVPVWSKTNIMCKIYPENYPKPETDTQAGEGVEKTEESGENDKENTKENTEDIQQ